MNLGFLDSLEVSTEGVRDGMIFVWRRGFDLDLVVHNQHMFSIVVFGEPSDQSWALTFIHSPCNPGLKAEFFNEVDRVGNSFGGP